MTLATNLLSLATRIGTEFKTIRTEIDTTLTDYYTSAEVDSAIAAVIDSSPAALDTLNELAAALGNDANFATTVTNLIGTKANSADVYTSAALDILLSGKANASDVYTRAQIDSTFAGLSKVDAGAFSSTDATVYADSSRTPQADPLNGGGWYFKNISAGQKINWYPYNGGSAITGAPTAGELTSIWAVVSFYNTTTNFILATYSKRTGTGDAGSWYKSRWIRSTKIGTIPAPAVAGTATKMLVFFGTDPGVHPELPRLQIADTLSSNSNGTRQASEEILTYSWGTNSASAVGTEEFTIEQVGHKMRDQAVARSLVHVGATIAEVALKANSADVYTKTQADSAVATTVGNAVSGIEGALGADYSTESFVASFEAALL